MNRAHVCSFQSLTFISSFHQRRNLIREENDVSSARAREINSSRSDRAMLKPYLSLIPRITKIVHFLSFLFSRSHRSDRISSDHHAICPLNTKGTAHVSPCSALLYVQSTRKLNIYPSCPTKETLSHHLFFFLLCFHPIPLKKTILSE